MAFDWHSILLSPDPDALLPAARDFCAIFRHPSLAIVKRPGQGRGVFASAPLAEGELLLIDVPLALSAPLESEDLANVHLAEQLSDYSRNNVQLRRRILALTDGDSAIDIPGADFFDFPETAVDGDEALVDFNRLLLVVRHNAFSGQLPRSNRVTTVIYGFTSMLNHACVPSAACFTMGTRKVLRACRPIAPGEEVTIMYFSSAGRQLEKRLELTKLVWGFTCACRWCAAEAQAPLVALKIKRLIATMNESSSASEVIVNDVLSVLEQEVEPTVLKASMIPSLTSAFNQLVAANHMSTAMRVFTSLQNMFFDHSPGSLQHCHFSVTLATDNNYLFCPPALLTRVVRTRYGCESSPALCALIRNSCTDGTWREFCNKIA